MQNFENNRDYQIITLDEIMSKIKEQNFKKYDFVAAIERGGILPGYLTAKYLNIPMRIISINFRDDSHKPRYDSPKIQKKIDFNTDGKNILLTDDVSNTGATLDKAIELIKDAGFIETLVISGNGDYSLFGVHNRCIKWPWY